MKILGIESSCDETAAAVVENGVKILSNVVVSQIDIFAEYGGVIPEVAARSHLEAVIPVINKALEDANCTWDDIDAIAVTHAPGLLGSLLIGTLTARTLAILHNKPLYATHHLKSHIYANWLESGAEEGFLRDLSAFRSAAARELARSARGDGPERRGAEVLKNSSIGFPILAMVISGGHTQILQMDKHNSFKIIGTTHDDAIGECFDKVAKILGLPYPGGPNISKLAEKGDENKYKLPHPKVEGLDFSFSGLKTAVLRAVQKEAGLPISHPSSDLKNHLTEAQKADFAASFEKTAIDILLEKLEKALEKNPETKSILFAGGVSANKKLREAAAKRFAFSELGEDFSTKNPSDSPIFDNISDLKNSADPSAIKNFSSPEHVVKNNTREYYPCSENAKRLAAVPPNLYFPSPKFSGDNGAMVAAAAYFEIQDGKEPTDPYKLNIYPRIEITK